MSDEGSAPFAWNDTPTRLRKALKQDEFALFCQPILALRGAGGFALAEVLIRLREEEQLRAEQPARSRAQSGRRAARSSSPGCSS